MGNLISYEIDYTHNQIIEYERLGTCDGCQGETLCCKNELLFEVMCKDGESEDDDFTRTNGGGLGTDNAGIWQGWKRDNVLIVRKLAHYLENGNVCPHLSKGKCTNYAQRGGYCEQFPLTPSDISNIPLCSYKFKIRYKWVLNEMESDNATK